MSLFVFSEANEVHDCRHAGEAVRALSWLGPDEVETGLDAIGRKLSPEDFEELAGLRAIMPNWIAEPASALVADVVAYSR